MPMTGCDEAVRHPSRPDYGSNAVPAPAGHSPAFLRGEMRWLCESASTFRGDFTDSYASREVGHIGAETGQTFFDDDEILHLSLHFLRPSLFEKAIQRA